MVSGRTLVRSSSVVSQRKLSGSSACSVSTSATYSPYADPDVPLSSLLGNAIGRSLCLDDKQVGFLGSLGLPEGLQQELIDSHQAFPVRLWILDNSGSMSTGDGHRMVKTAQGERTVGCSRWAELADSLEWHARVSAHLGAASEFRLLNPVGPQMVRVGFGQDHADREVERVKQLCATQPTGSTPLCERVREAIQRIAEVAPQLRAAGQRACLVICSDGAATDGDIAAAMRPLRSLPVWVVIRLCTDEDKVLEYWNNIDE